MGCHVVDDEGADGAEVLVDVQLSGDDVDELAGDNAVDVWHSGDDVGELAREDEVLEERVLMKLTARGSTTVAGSACWRDGVCVAWRWRVMNL